jgi:hypothetical protein
MVRVKLIARNTEVLYGQDGRTVTGNIGKDAQNDLSELPLVRQEDVEPL